MRQNIGVVICIRICTKGFASNLAATPFDVKIALQSAPDLPIYSTMTPQPVQIRFQRQPVPLASRRWGLLAWLLLVCGAAGAQGGNGAVVATDVARHAEGSADAQPPRPASKIYKYLSNGTTSFSDKPPSSGTYVVMRYTCYACSLNSTVDWHSTPLHHDKFADEINLAARQFNVDPALVRAVIHAESGFNAHARSPKGAVGLMQLMPKTARLLGVANSRVPRENIHGGAKYLAELLGRFKNDVVLATAAYNAGPEAVQKYAGVPPYAETRVYVQRVRILHQRYKGAPQV
jgi:soluble lytic murein transglycosylase-like protein